MLSAPYPSKMPPPIMAPRPGWWMSWMSPLGTRRWLPLSSTIVIFKLGVSGQPVVAQGRSSAIHAASAPNTITGQCTEVSNGATHLVMTVNGVVVGSATDTHGGGPISWHSALTVYRSQTSPQVVGRFTNFRTYNAGGS